MNLFQNKKNTSHVESENPYWISFSDIMAGLLAIFILTMVTLMIQLNEQINITKETRQEVEKALEELAQIEEIRKDLLEEVQINLEERNIHVEISENNSVLRIPDEQLYFYSGKYIIPQNRENLLNAVGKVLETALINQDRLRYIDTIFIEGHTDSQRYDKEMGNWGLSTYRAIAVWNFWTDNPGKQNTFIEMLNMDNKPLFSVSGYADTRRVELEEKTNSERKRNRRIDLRFTMRTPISGDLRRLLDKFKTAGL